MNHRGALLNLGITAALVGGCAAAPSVPIQGATGASPKGQRDAERILRAFFEQKGGCAQLAAIESESTPVAGTTRSTTKERWTAVGCGKRMSMDFAFTTDANGNDHVGFQPPR